MSKATMTLGALFAAITPVHSAALAMTQDEAIAAIRQQVSNGGGGATGGAYGWMAGVALVLAIVLLLMRWRRGRRARRPALNNPARLVTEVRREAGMTRADVRTLRRQAAAMERRTGVKAQSPLLIVLCPSLKGKRAG